MVLDVRANHGHFGIIEDVRPEEKSCRAFSFPAFTNQGASLRRG